MLNAQQVTGRTRTHIHQFDFPRFAAIREAGEAFLAMRDAAKQDGFDLVPYSSFRDFKTQLRIWNYKFVGKKPLYDINGNIRQFDQLSEEEIVDFILNWSAVPGASRHQWGTEIDVIDGNSMPTNYEPLLLPEEVRLGGIFHALHLWLDKNISRFGFFRPYAKYIGGMYPEPWHLSYGPLSLRAIEDLSPEVVLSAIEPAPLLGKKVVINQLDKIFAFHIRNYILPAESAA